MVELIRFFSISVIGVIFDIAISYLLASLLSAPFWLAATVGFSVAAIMNYFSHEKWTFRSDAPRRSRKRAIYFFISSGVSLFSRLAIIAWLSASISGDHTLMILTGGAAVSFFVNYIISKVFIFSKRTEQEVSF